jgi:hypothetical protein
MAVFEIAKIQVRRGQENQTGIPQLDPGEFGWAEDTEHLYIGKRIVEGANSDENSRILTEKDYDNLFAIVSSNLGGTVSSTSTVYRYRDTLKYPTPLASTGSHFSTKLDTFVNLVDFIPPSVLITWSQTTGATLDITNYLETAIQNLYASTLTNMQRTLNIPAGNFTVNTNRTEKAIKLPPYTSLVGQGPGITTLIALSTNTSVFQTIDSNGHTFESGMLSAKASNAIHIEGMTVAYANTFSTAPLVLLDNTTDATIRNVNFRVLTLSTITEYGTAIALRGTGGSGVEQSSKVTVEQCNFTNIGLGLTVDGPVTGLVADNNIFENLNQGIKFLSTTTDGPTKAVISKNKFENIVKEAVFVGTQTNRASHISDSNTFNTCGGGDSGLTEFLTTSTGVTPVMTFYGEGCVSINDNFNRQLIGSTNTDATFYYNPLIEGRTTISNGGVYTATISGNTDIVNFPIVNGDQLLNIRYKLYDNLYNYSRSGFLTMNIAKPTDSVVTATQLVSQTNIGSNILTIVSNTATQAITTGDVVTALISGISRNTTVVQVTPSGGNLNVQVSNSTSAIIPVGTTATFTRGYLAFGSVSDYYDYSYTDLWPGAGSDQAAPDAIPGAHPAFNVSDPDRGFISLTCDPNTSDVYTMEYQYDIQT